MFKITCLTVLTISIVSCSHQSVRRPSSEPQLSARTEFKELVNYTPLNLIMRAGYALETTDLKGCILYLQGLGDSIQNHKPFFSRLNDAGYRVIFFDYLGQGGSEGSMNDTRVQVKIPPNSTRQMLRKYHERDRYYEIPEQGDFFWSKYRNVKNRLGQNCSESPKIVLGWSTGGLSAYRMAYEKRADAVILIAPGIHPKVMVGESAHRWDKMLLFQQTITEHTLTRNRFEGVANPHLDPIKPKSPATVPQFAGNLLGIASQAKLWKINQSVRGIVFLSGVEDSYVDRDSTLQTLRENASHFEVKSYDGALHELDNELPEVASDLYENSLRFLDSVTVR
jgi:alpha-beta hydrolase superfamily lysophospholipase